MVVGVVAGSFPMRHKDTEVRFGLVMAGAARS
jgi:hypothetical protein